MAPFRSEITAPASINAAHSAPGASRPMPLTLDGNSADVGDSTSEGDVIGSGGIGVGWRVNGWLTMWELALSLRLGDGPRSAADPGPALQLKKRPFGDSVASVGVVISRSSGMSRNPPDVVWR